jgi:hypothetical protein
VSQVAAGAVIRQTFVAPSDGLEAVTVYVRAGRLERPARVLVELQRPGRDIEVPLYSRILEVPARGGPLALEFPPFAHSEGERFQLWMRLVAPTAGDVGLEAFTEGEVHPGTLSVDGREQWADLKLRLTAESRYRAFLGRVKLTGWRGSPWLHMALLALYNWALITFTYGILIGRTDRGTGLVEPLGPP